jgi:hypothetical protein
LSLSCEFVFWGARKFSHNYKFFIGHFGRSKKIFWETSESADVSRVTRLICEKIAQYEAQLIFLSKLMYNLNLGKSSQNYGLLL